MTNRYTKTVLTIIAAALVGLLAVQLTPVAHAQISDACGGYTDPCFVKMTGGSMTVSVDNWPAPYPR